MNRKEYKFVFDFLNLNWNLKYYKTKIKKTMLVGIIFSSNIKNNWFISILDHLIV
jgi:hypothetical protein